MQREIKFRGKRVNNEEWVYGDLWSMPDNRFAIVNDGNQWCNSKDFNPITVIPETVGEYAGLKDKNGKEIYEGDIIHYFDGNIENQDISEVKWLNEPTCVGYDIDPTVLKYCEVIGNIYENSDLIK